jgi:hypothetical protein
MNANTDDFDQSILVYRHRGLPPMGGEAMAEHTVEANSGRVADDLHRDEWWNGATRS